jgi:predicted membrane-bound dolichyl-phosphate-mannose-protein mannosyltransferase
LADPDQLAVERPGRLDAARAVFDRRIVATLSDPGFVLPALLLFAFIARGAWIDRPPGALIFDEAYYVNAGRVMLGWTVPDGAHYDDAPLGLDPNIEHPALGKAVMALTMSVVGDNGLGWRLPSLVASMIALAAFYGVMRAAGASVWLAILALYFLALDNLTLVHGRIGTLDMLALAPMLVGAWLALRGRWILAGLAMGVAVLVKLTAVYGLLALLLFIALRGVQGWREHRAMDRAVIRDGVALIVAFGVVAFAGLWVLDARFTTFTSPVDHIGHMLRYGASLTTEPGRGAACPTASAPWQWLFNDCRITYLRVSVPVEVETGVFRSIPTVSFQGAMNPLLAASIPIASLYAIWAAARATDPLARWSVVWAAATFMPFVLLVIAANRVTYLYYILPVVPALAAALAVLLTRAGLPRFVLWAYVVAYGLGFVAYYPFRAIP